MVLVFSLLLLVPAAPDLGLGGGLGRSQDEQQNEEDQRPEPILLPEMPGEKTSELRSFHPLLSDLIGLARPIREMLREIDLWNLRPDYRHGEFCISWEIEFSL